MMRGAHIWIWMVCCGLACVSCTRHAADEATSLYEEGKALREQGEPVEAMQTFLRAAHSGTNDEVLLGRIYANMANMCRQANEHETAYRVYSLSATHFASSCDTLLHAYALNNMAWEQAVMGQKDLALTLAKEAVMTAPCELIREKVRETHAAACLFAKEYDSVLYYSVPPADDYLLMLRGQAWSYLQEDDSATYYAQLLLPRTTNLFYLDDIYYILTHNDPCVTKDELRRMASERADVQKGLEERHAKLAQAVQFLEQDLARKDCPWGQLLLAVVIATAVTGSIAVWLVQKRKQIELADRMRTLCNAESVKNALHWNDYPTFCQETDQQLNGLAHTIQKKGLNEQDIRICVLVLLGLSHKEMADLLNCSPKSIGKLKDLTAHKLGVSGGHLQEEMLQICSKGCKKRSKKV